MIRRPALWFYTTSALVIFVALILTVAMIGPFPPRVVVMTTGMPGSAYDVYGQQYKAILSRSGVEVRLLPSAGGVENLQRLQDPSAAVSVGFVQGGLTNGKGSPGLLSLGTLFYEPLWFFYRGHWPGRRMEAFRGKKVSFGPQGSGTRALASEFLKLNGLDENVAQVVSLGAAQAGDALLAGDIVAAAMVASWDTPVVRRLLASSDVELANFPRADAYVALYPFLSKLVLPAGVGNMATNRPPADVNLLAPKASLLIRRDLHPAIQYLLLDAAAEIHSAPGIFQKAGQFPAAEQEDLPLSKEASQFYKSGRPFLQRYLPFWLAVFVGRLLVLMIPVVGVAYPLLRVVPAAYGWSMRRRIFRLYGELKFIEAELEAGEGLAADGLMPRLDRLEERANHLRVPTAFAHFLYQLRNHIGLVRQRLQRRAG